MIYHNLLVSRRVTRTAIRIALAILVVLGAVSAAMAASDAQSALQVPASVHARINSNSCDNSPGPYITLSGELMLGGMDGALIFRNNRKGTHTHREDVKVGVEILPPGETIRFAKQPSRGGVGGNPFIYVQFLDDSGGAISDEIFVGRCVQGLDQMVSFDFVHNAVANASITAGECNNTSGPYITLSGELILSGIRAKLIFRNNEDGPHEYEKDVEVGVVILPPGETISFAKQPPQGGAGGNPLIYFQFEESGPEFFMGRCTQL